MRELRLTDQQKELIEELGVFHEQTGLQPAAARIISLLLVSDRQNSLLMRSVKC